VVLLQWCVDFGLETILAVWGGLYLDGEIIAEGDLQVYIDSALNEIEFLTVTSRISSPWYHIKLTKHRGLQAQRMEP
jgi:hypothetical protein